ncbi:MAG: tRNA 2-thiouridine(34) synthase MnmA [Patescibacteria group bacterium]|nr:tRNA 2-thiouridine(34) synthase MnmA [Patescibacteria group bacterium]
MATITKNKSKGVKKSSKSSIKRKSNPSTKLRADLPKSKSKRSWHWKDYFKSSPLKLPQDKTQKIVFVAMSGGVDSSVTAYLLKEQGYYVVGAFMKNWSFPIENIKECPLYQDYLDMVKVCKFLKIPYQVWSFEKEYRKRVIDEFFKGYEAGITPNPDVLCNTEIKFDMFLEKALKLGADYIATGHHIRSRCGKLQSFKITSFRHPELVSGSKKIPDQVRNDGKAKVCSDYQLLKGKDFVKDQTYFVYGLTQEQLSRCIFPIGEYEKREIREIADKLKLPTAKKRDSQGICFIGRIDVKDFLKTRLKEEKGDIVTKDGKKLGEHEGSWFYTIGQRRIEGLSGTVRPYYVIGKDSKKNLVIVGDDKDTYSNAARIKKLHLINKKYKPKDLLEIVLTAKSRYTPELSRGKLKKDSQGYYFEFVKPERAVTPGQSLVLFKGEVCLGGGVITKAIN